MRKSPTNLPVAIAYKEKILAALQAFDCEILSLEGLTEDGLLFNVEDADRVADVFIRENVDAVFVPHCNFGSEESVARLCKKVGKPVLLWGPKDEINPEDFYRYRDSQCGLFATSKVLNMYGVPFTYIENCSVDDPTFAEGFQRFLAVVSVVKAFRNLRIGQIGARPAPFASVKCNEMELLQKFGIEILPMTMTDLRARLEKWAAKQSINAELFEYESGEAFLAAHRERPVQVLFLDIYMSGANGIQTAEALRQTDTDCLLIFTTTSTDHALEGFRVRAMHYLVKPYAEKDVFALMDEVLARLPRPDRYLLMKVSGSDVRMPLRDILYAEHFSHMIHVHTASGRTCITRQSFGDFTAQLQTEDRFFICSRGVVVNLEHALDFDGAAFRLDDGSTVAVSRDLIKKARQALMDFLFERGRM